MLKPARQQATPRLAVAEQMTLAVLAAGLIAIPAIFTSGMDAFRLPKELLFRAEAITLAMLAIFWLTSKGRRWSFVVRPEILLAGAIVLWSIVTTASSTNRLLSTDSLITIVAAAVIFVATCLAARTTGLIAVDVLMAASCLNAVIVILQELKIWTPFPSYPGSDTHYGSVGLLGNANDVGTYLVAPAVAAIVLTATSARTRRRIYALIAVLLVSGVAASATRTALVALIAALIVFAIGHSRRAVLAVAAILLMLGLVVAAPSTTIGQGIRKLAAAVKHRDYENVFSERLPPFLTAFDMTRDHLLLGVGPGCFKYHFMAYRVALRDRYPAAWTRGYPMNWGEVHNDHLQVAAETGLMGYALFLTAIAIGSGIAKRTPRGASAESQETTFARAFRRPFATAVFVICLGQFPLELAAPRLIILTLGAICVTWNREHVAL